MGGTPFWNAIPLRMLWQRRVTVGLLTAALVVGLTNVLDIGVTVDVNVHRRSADPGGGHRRSMDRVMDRAGHGPGRLMAVVGNLDVDAAKVKHDGGYESPDWLLKLNVNSTKDPRSLPRTTASKVAPVPNRSSSFTPGWNGDQTPLKKVTLQLDLADQYAVRPEFLKKETTYRRFGFDLRESNRLPLDRTLPDYRSDECKAIQYPDPAVMPKVSVIIIYYNEALSTLLRNIVSVINNSPPELLGEIILIDDNSTLDELAELPSHLDAIRAQTDKRSPGLIRSFRRNEHTGIVGARIRGGREAKYDILLFLDSHCETAAGWLEPLVARIHGDRTTVVVPNVRGFELDTLALISNKPWPPSKGVMSWRVNYQPVMADMEADLLDPAHPAESPVRMPVMPGGLFAMDRKFYFELGEYDPELLYYGAEHVELSVRIWMCGGTMEAIPCSNVGHIFREFNRFDAAADPLISKVNIGKVLNRNDARVAAVWMDEYTDLFYRLRGLEGIDLGPKIEARHALRSRLQCKPFRWFVDAVNSAEYYAPDPQGRVEMFKVGGDAADAGCLTSMDAVRGGGGGGPQVAPCVPVVEADPWERMAGKTRQYWTYTADGHIQTAFHIKNKEMLCLKIERLHMISCDGAAQFVFEKVDPPSASAASSGSMLPSPWQAGFRYRVKGTSSCLERRVNLGDPTPISLQRCSDTVRQRFRFDEITAAEAAYTAPVNGSKAGCIVGATPGWAGGDACFDNMQQKRGAFGFGDCHRGGTQQWRLLADGRIQAATDPDVCMGVTLGVGQGECTRGDVEQEWLRRGTAFRLAADPRVCLQRVSGTGLVVGMCDQANKDQIWASVEPDLDFSVGLSHVSRFN